MLTKSVVLFSILATTLSEKVPHGNIYVFEQGNGRIVGGTTAANGQFPFQALLLKSSDGSLYTYCSGSILSNRWIVTAGQCTYDTTPDAVAIVVGTLRPFDAGVSTMVVSKFVLHPDFDMNYYINDISMVQTVSAIALTPTVHPIKLGTSHIGDSIAATVSGWGIKSVCNIDNLLRTKQDYK